MKSLICSVAGAVGSAVACLFGGWDASVITLLIFMVIDYISGLVVAGVFHKSNKSETGALESRAGWKGLIKKCVTLIFIIVAVRLDILTLQLGLLPGGNYIRDAVCIAFILNELISITENAGLMGVPIPTAITKAIELLKSKEGEKE